MLIPIILAAVGVAASIVFLLAWRKAIAQRNAVAGERDRVVARFQGVVDADAERQRVLSQLGQEQAAARSAMERERSAATEQLTTIRQQLQLGNGELSTLQRRIGELKVEFAALDEESNLQSFGFYKPHYAFTDSQQYAGELDRIRNEQKLMLKEKRAAICQIEWTVNGSKVEGRKQTNQTLKLMLRAFNGESDAAIAKVRYNNVHVMEARILKAHEMVNGLAEVQQCMITKQYRDLKLQELRLAHEYEEKVQEEKEEQRRIREQMREEEIAQREIEKARLEAEREEERYAKALAKAREEAEKAVGAKQEKLLGDIEELRRRLAEAQNNKERAIARAQMTRSGHVYVISNIGSFGEHVYKVGMTRRLDPLDRIKELGDASVPFQFDVHAMIFSEDAPALEKALHKAFHRQRVNRVNEKKEFFRVTIHEIANMVRQHAGEITVTLAAEAAEFRKTVAIVDDEKQQAARIPIKGEAPGIGNSLPAVPPADAKPEVAVANH